MATRRRRARKNPNGLMGIVKQAAPVALSLYGTRFATGALKTRLPMMDKLQFGGRDFSGTAVAALLAFGAHMATSKVKGLKKHRQGILIGAGINLIDNLLSAVAPDSVKGMFGLAGGYDKALADYVEVGDYLQVGQAPPIDDDITLSDYVEVGGVEEDLGAIEAELGMLEQDLGLEQAMGAADPLSRKYLGGVARGSMLAPVGHQKLLAPVPARSFTKAVPEATAQYDNPRSLSTGIFAGGIFS
jgi:hypothetical protein